jgi:hypothetical protein
MKMIDGDCIEKKGAGKAINPTICTSGPVCPYADEAK